MSSLFLWNHTPTSWITDIYRKFQLLLFPLSVHTHCHQCSFLIVEKAKYLRKCLLTNLLVITVQGKRKHTMSIKKRLTLDSEGNSSNKFQKKKIKKHIYISFVFAIKSKQQFKCFNIHKKCKTILIQDIGWSEWWKYYTTLKEVWLFLLPWVFH